MALAAGEANSDPEFRKHMQKPLVRFTDMPLEMKTEVTEIVEMAISKAIPTRNWEGAAATIKQTLDKKFAPTWHCAIGEGFGYEITYQTRNMCYLFVQDVGILLYKT